jgi:hypothetical protein
MNYKFLKTEKITLHHSFGLFEMWVDMVIKVPLFWTKLVALYYNTCIITFFLNVFEFKVNFYILLAVVEVQLFNFVKLYIYI